MTSFGIVADHLTQFMASFGNFATFPVGFTIIDSAETTCVYDARHLALLLCLLTMLQCFSTQSTLFQWHFLMFDANFTYNYTTDAAFRSISTCTSVTMHNFGPNYSSFVELIGLYGHDFADG